MCVNLFFPIKYNIIFFIYDWQYFISNSISFQSCLCLIFQIPSCLIGIFSWVIWNHNPKSCKSIFYVSNESFDDIFLKIAIPGTHAENSYRWSLGGHNFNPRDCSVSLYRELLWLNLLLDRNNWSWAQWVDLFRELRIWDRRIRGLIWSC